MSERGSSRSTLTVSDLFPSGIRGEFADLESGGSDDSWIPFQSTKYFTNAFIIKEDKILLGLKKRGFGINKWNGFGGKVDPGETSAEAARRELREESGIDAHLGHVGIFLFMVQGYEQIWHIDLYSADSYTGEPTETEEMRPQWFALPEVAPSSSLPPIPFDEMWESDKTWFPKLLSRRPFCGRADFTQEGPHFLLRKWWFGHTTSTDLSAYSA